MDNKSDKYKFNTLNVNANEMKFNGKEFENDKRSENKNNIFDRFENEMNKFKRNKKVEENITIFDIHKEIIEFYHEMKNLLNDSFFKINTNEFKEFEIEKENFTNPNFSIKMLILIKERISASFLRLKNSKGYFKNSINSNINDRLESNSISINKTDDYNNYSNFNDDLKNSGLKGNYLHEIETLKSKLSEAEKMINYLYKEREGDKITIETLKNKILFNNTNYYINNNDFNGEESIFRNSMNNLALNSLAQSQYSADFNKYKDSKSSIHNNQNTLYTNYKNDEKEKENLTNINDNNALHIMSFADCGKLKDSDLIEKKSNNKNMNLNLEDLYNNKEIKHNDSSKLNIDCADDTKNKSTRSLSRLEDLNKKIEDQKKEFENKLKVVEQQSKDVSF